MEFTLVYDGKVLSFQYIRENGKKVQGHVETIRQAFHEQLKSLWALPPLKDHLGWWKNPHFSGRDKNGRKCVWLVTNEDDLDMYVKLDIHVLTHPGHKGFKDIDNRLKTICDALAPVGSTSPDASDEEPFFCLLKNDMLIYQVSVDTDFDLRPNGVTEHSLWVIHVKIKGNKCNAEYMDLLV